MEKTKLIEIRIEKGFDIKEIARLLKMGTYSYRRRENGEIKISHEDWVKLAKIFKVELEAIFEPEKKTVKSENEPINNQTTVKSKYKIPCDIYENQQEYILILKNENEKLKNKNITLKEENKLLKEEIKALKNK